MKDRIATYPGRVKATKVAGTEDTFDITRADSPKQIGTPLRESTLMSNETAALVGLGEDDTPDQMLEILAKRQAQNTKDIETNSTDILDLQDWRDFMMSDEGGGGVGGGAGHSTTNVWQQVALDGGASDSRQGKDGAEAFNTAGVPEITSQSGWEWTALNQGGNGAIGYYSHAEGKGTMAVGDYTHAEGWNCWAVNDHTHAEGVGTAAIGKYSHVEGRGSLAGKMEDGTKASHGADGLAGESAHAEGWMTNAEGRASHSEGADTYTSGYASHAEGSSTEATGDDAHAEGLHTEATGGHSHAAGAWSRATASCACAMGEYTIANAMDSLVIGNANRELNTSANAQDLFVIGNGGGYGTTRSNCFRVDIAGYVHGKYFEPSGADYAEYFEWADGNPNGEDRVGRFVTLDGNKIAFANPGDYILGVVSGGAGVIGNGDEDWVNRWKKDAYGRDMKEYTETKLIRIKDQPKTENERRKLQADPSIECKSGVFYRKVEEAVTDRITDTWRRKQNPDYDPTIRYIERKDRKEWDAVGMLGVLPVDDDGTCAVNGFCKVSDNGTVTKADKYIHGETYRVIERVTPNVVKIVLK